MLLLCAFFQGSTAQTKEFFKENKHELRLSYGSVNDDSYYSRYHFHSGYNYYGYYGLGYYGNQPYYNMSVYQGATKTTGVFSLSYFYNMPNPRFSFGATLSYSGFNTGIFNRVDDSKAGNTKSHNFAITPMVRYSWLSKEKLRLYSGIGWSFYAEKVNAEMEAKASLSAVKQKETHYDNAFMITPIGISFGKELFVFGELNWGGRAGNIVGGVGYRF
jgi:hypothetical protein